MRMTSVEVSNCAWGAPATEVACAMATAAKSAAARMGFCNVLLLTGQGTAPSRAETLPVREASGP